MVYFRNNDIESIEKYLFQNILNNIKINTCKNTDPNVLFQTSGNSYGKDSTCFQCYYECRFMEVYNKYNLKREKIIQILNDYEINVKNKKNFYQKMEKINDYPKQLYYCTHVISMYYIQTFIRYILKRLVSNEPKYVNIHCSNIMTIFKNGIPKDDIIFNEFRKIIENNNIDPRKIEQNNSGYIEQKTVDILKEKLNKCDVIINDNKTVNILDIGTERMSMISKYKKTFNGDKVFGINIDTGFSHYDGSIDNQICIYDGKNIPNFGDIKFDIITMTSVIHHIEKDSFKALINQLYDLTNNNALIYIKDNNIKNITSKVGIMIQHMIYEGYILNDEPNQLYFYDLDIITNILNENGFELLDHNISHNFSSTFYALFRKKKKNNSSNFFGL